MARGSEYTCGFGIVAASPSRSVKSESVPQEKKKTSRNAAKPSAEAHDRAVCRNAVQRNRSDGARLISKDKPPREAAFN